MKRHTVPETDWGQHLARALLEACSGDVIILPTQESYVVAQQVARETYPHKDLRFCVPGVSMGMDPTSGVSVEQYMQLRTLEGNPPTPGEIQKWLDYERRRMEKEKVLREWFTCMLDEFLDPALEVGGMELIETSETLIQELAYHIGACIHSTAQALAAHREGCKLFLDKAEKTIQDQMELGMAHGYEE